MSQHTDTTERLSRLETMIDSINLALERIQTKLETQGKVNWAPVAIGVTVFFTVAGSISTIYNARISTINTAVESIAVRSLELEKVGVESKLKIQVQEERLKQIEEDIDKLEARD